MKPKHLFAAPIFAATALALALPAHAASDDSTITVTQTDATVTVTSTKDLSNIIVRYCDGTYAKFEQLTGHAWTHGVPPYVDAVWVHAGDNHDDADPQPGEYGNGNSVGKFFDLVCDPVDPPTTTTVPPSTTVPPTTTVVVPPPTTVPSLPITPVFTPLPTIASAETQVAVEMSAAVVDPPTTLAYTGAASKWLVGVGFFLLVIGSALLALFKGPSIDREHSRSGHLNEGAE